MRREQSLEDLLKNLGGGDMFGSLLSNASRGGAETTGNWLDWQSVLDLFLARGTKRAKKVAKSVKCKVEVTYFDPHGLVEAEVILGGRRFEVSLEADFDRKTLVQDCGCGKADEYSCEHILLLAKHLKANLAEFGITETTQQEDVPGIISAIDQFLEQQAEVTSAVLPPEKSLNHTRIVWRLVTSPYVELVPVQQKLNKKGTSWSKGKKLKIETVLNSPARYHCTQTDRDVLDCVEDTYYDMRVDLLKALDQLVGHELFQLDDQPAEIIRRTLALQLEQDEDVYQLRIDVDGHRPSSYIFHREGLLAFDLDRNRVAVIRCNEMQATMAESLVMEAVGFTSSSIDTLMKRVEPLRQLIPITLPEELGGKSVAEDCRLVLQLRARQNGGLDAAIRVRDSKGRLARPGEGLLRFPGTLEGETGSMRSRCCSGTGTGGRTCT